jgi:hypothetical protein
MSFGTTQRTDDGRVRVEIAQGRSDYASETISVRVETLVADVVVHSVVLSGEALGADAEWREGALIPDGAARDLRVGFPGAICPVPSATTEVVVDYTFADIRQTSRLAPADPFGVIERLADRDCLARSVASAARLTLSDSLAVATSDDGTATLEILVEPSGDADAPSFTIESVDATTLLSPAHGDARWTVDAVVRPADEPSSIRLPVSPARCDAHAVAEDKVGTILPVRVRLDSGAAGIVHVPSSDVLRSALYEFIARSCDR